MTRPRRTASWRDARRWLAGPLCAAGALLSAPSNADEPPPAPSAASPPAPSAASPPAPSAAPSAEPPPPAPPAPASSVAAPAAPNTPPAPAAPIDVTVVGDPRPPGTVSLGKGEVRALPGAFGDPFRAVEAMPGVTPVFSGIPFFYVRGAPPGNVGYFLDGVRVPALFHILAGPAVVPPSLIERVDLHPGGYPAEYGRFAGGIVAGETRAPATETHAESTLRLIDAGSLVEAPLPGGMGSALAGARFSYTAPVLSLFVSQLRFGYWDYQGRVVLNLSPTQRLTIFAFGAHDNLEQQVGPPFDTPTWIPLYATEFHRVDVRYDVELGDRTRLQQAVTFGIDRSQATGAVRQSPIVHDTMISARTHIHHRWSDSVLLRAGLDAQFDAYEGKLDGPLKIDTSLFSTRQDLVVGAFADAVIEPGHGVQITPGARVDLWGSGGTTALSGDVRLAARAPVTPRVRVVSTLGLAHQAPGFAVHVPGVAIGGLSGGLQTSFQTSGGVEADLPLDITGSATFFYNAFFDLSDPLGLSGYQGGSTPQANSNLTNLSWLNDRALGSAVGLEIYLHRKLTKKLGGFLSYTLSRSTRYIGTATFAAQFDRTHSLGAALSWDIGRGFRVGSRVTFYTGMPLSPFYPAASVAAYGSDRLPPFFRLDVRAEKRFSIDARRWLSIVAEVQNATLSVEPNGLQCYWGAALSCQPTGLGPVTLPSLGLEAGL